MRVVIQARMSSTRLRGKALLSLAGVPVVVLAARRAASRGAAVIVATSTDPSDDILATVLAENGIRLVRGPLDNVLERFVLATADMVDRDTVVRLTADNVFPDGEFIERIVDERLSTGVDYVGTRSPVDGLPYGLSAEAFTVAMLRLARESASSEADREHVTPWIRRNGSCRYVDRTLFGLDSSYEHLRCTIDSQDDYIRMMELFTSLGPDSAGASWRRLVDALAARSDVPRPHSGSQVDGKERPLGELSLGTAQLGMPYGVANRTGQPSAKIAARILREAIDHGVTLIDTARAYGDAERRIGESLTEKDRERVSVITKLDPLNQLDASASTDQIRDAIDASVMDSRRELRCHFLDVLMLHRWRHRRQFGGIIWDRVLELKEEGAITQLGASVQSPVEAMEALNDIEIRHIQLPYNLLDWRWGSPVFLEKLSQRSDVSVHVRSAYLQGILVSGATSWPRVLEDREQWIKRLERLVATLGRGNRADLCLAFVRGAPWVTSIVIGVETEEQLRENLQLWLRPPLDLVEQALVQERLSDAPPWLLDPSSWETCHET